MKKIVFTFALCIVMGFAANAQKYACVSTEYILSNIPEYDEAQKKLDQYSIDWQKEIESKFQEIDKLYKSYQSEEYLLPEDLKIKRQDEIIAKEKEAKDLQKKRFGKDGDLTKKREELIKPIQDRVFTAIDEYAKEKGYAFVFDVAGSMTIIYADPKWDINDQIMQKLGISAGDELDD